MNMKPQPYVAVGEQHQGDGRQGQSDLDAGTSLRSENRGRWSSWTENGWLPETASACLGSALVAALVIVLSIHDGKASPQFGNVFGTALTLNTVVAILSASSKAALLWPVTECMSQLKWLWFSTSTAKPLQDFASFDVASRSTWGGFELMRRTKFRTLAVIGSLLMFLSLAMDPLSQQLVAFVPTAVPSDGPLNQPGRDNSSASLDPTSPASIATARTWYDGRGQAGGVVINSKDRSEVTYFNGYGHITSRAKGAIQRGLNNGGNKVAELAPVCQTGNCTFSPYKTLGVCTSFADVSSHIRKVDYDDRFMTDIYGLTKDIAIRQSYVFEATSAATDLEPKGDSRIGPDPPLNFTASIAFKNVSYPIADMFVLYFRGTRGGGFHKNHTIKNGVPVYGATEVLLEWCIQERTTEVRSGVVTSRIISEQRNFTMNPRYRMAQGTLFSNLADEGPVCEVAADTHTSTSYYFGRVFRGHVAIQGAADMEANTDVAPALYEPFDIFTGIGVPENNGSVVKSLRRTNNTGLETIFDNIAESMTNLVRGEGEYFEGLQYRQEIVVHVRWPWIVAHAVFTIFSIALLVGTIVSQRISSVRGHTWKSSTLAVLHALDPMLLQQSSGISDESTLSVPAKRQMVRLRRTDDYGWRLHASDKDSVDDIQKQPTSYANEAAEETYPLQPLQNGR